MIVTEEIDEEEKCQCKPLVDGKNCDECKQGTWNLTQQNPMGCQSKSLKLVIICACTVVRTCTKKHIELFFTDESKQIDFEIG